MLIAAVPDIDGLGFLISPDAYWKYHHLIFHNLMAAILVSFVFAFLAEQRLKAFFVFLFLFHLHLLMDYFGSGDGWMIFYFWPFSAHGIKNPIGWPFLSWQNTLVGLIFIIWTIWIVVYQQKTFFEFLLPGLDREFVKLPAKWKCNILDLFGKSSD